MRRFRISNRPFSSLYLSRSSPFSLTAGGPGLALPYSGGIWVKTYLLILILGLPLFANAKVTNDVLERLIEVDDFPAFADGLANSYANKVITPKDRKRLERLTVKAVAQGAQCNHQILALIARLGVVLPTDDFKKNLSANVACTAALESVYTLYPPTTRTVLAVASLEPISTEYRKAREMMAAQPGDSPDGFAGRVKHATVAISALGASFRFLLESEEKVCGKEGKGSGPCDAVAMFRAYQEKIRQNCLDGLKLASQVKEETLRNDARLLVEARTGAFLEKGCRTEEHRYQQ